MVSSYKGFTLIEVLVALVLFAIALTGFASLLTGTLQANAQAKRRTAAVNLAQDKLEELRTTAAPEAGSDTVQELGAGTYTRDWTVGAGPTPTASTVTVTVTWTRHGTHDVQLTTVIRQ